MKGLSCLRFSPGRSGRPKPAAPGKLVGAFLFFYGCFRFGIEFIREPDSQLVRFAQATGLHMGQWLSLPMIALGLWLMLTANKRRVRVEPTGGCEPLRKPRSSASNRSDDAARPGAA